MSDDFGRVASKTNPPYRTIAEAVRVSTYWRVARRFGSLRLADFEMVWDTEGRPDLPTLVFLGRGGLVHEFDIDDLYERANTIEGMARVAAISYIRVYADRLEELIRGRG